MTKASQIHKHRRSRKLEARNQSTSRINIRRSLNKAHGIILTTIEKSINKPQQRSHQLLIQLRQIARSTFIIQTFELRNIRSPKINSSRRYNLHTSKLHKRTIKRKRIQQQKGRTGERQTKWALVIMSS